MRTGLHALTSVPSELIVLIAVLLFLLGVVALVLQMNKLHVNLKTVMLTITRQAREHAGQQKSQIDELRMLLIESQRERAALQRTADKILAEATRVRATASSTPVAPPPVTPIPRGRPSRDFEFSAPEETTSYVAEDGVAQLLSMANHIVQQTSISLDAFRARAGALASRVSAWPAGSESAPVAFLVEHRGVWYAVPNVVKPGRLPEAWFNRSDFGVNDEIQHVTSLPRLIRRGDRYDVEKTGVFAK
jgi:hypothetical protein